MRLPLQAVLAATMLAAAHVGAQPPAATLSLGAALDRAERGAYANRAQSAMAGAQRAQSLAPLRGVLPSVRFDAGFLRTTDPIGAFGTSLRQRVITQQDFDPRRLNYPAVAQNWTGAVVLEQPLFNADALVGRRAATRAGDAALASAQWAAIATRVDVIRAYFGAVLAAEKATMLESSMRAARAHVKQAEEMARNGLVTPSDALLASVKAGEVETLLLEAQGEAANARLGLATLLGAPADTAWTLPPGLPASDALRTLAAATLDEAPRLDRADLAAARAGAAAASADALRARSLYMPRLNGFARYDWNSSLRPFGGDNNWTVGVMASWSPFAGASELSELRATASRREAADAMHEGAEAKARLEIQQSATMLRTALARLEIAERAVRQSADAHRIVSRKYAGGLAPVVELLDASAIEMQSRLGHAAVRYQVIVATAERRKALGLDPADIRSLDQAPLVAAASDSPSHDAPSHE
jgi:outer membrane protein TolC